LGLPKKGLILAVLEIRKTPPQTGWFEETHHVNDVNLGKVSFALQAGFGLIKR
jgi:hypothetical protein